MGRWFAASVASTMIACASLASAQPVALDWNAPAGCPDAAAMRANVARLLARSEAVATGVRATGQVTRQRARWVLQLTLDVQGRPATRALSAADCATLSDTAAWLVAVAIDPQLSPPPAPPPATDPARAKEGAAKEGAAREEGAREEGAREESAKEESAKEESAKEESAKEEGEREEGANAELDDDPSDEDDAAEARLSWHLGVFGGAFAGGLAGPNPSLGARVSLERGGFSLDLAFAHHFETGKAVPTLPRAESEFAAQELALAGCYAWGRDVRVGPCAVLSGLLVHAEVTRISQPHADSVLWSTLGASLVLGYRGFAPWELFADGGLWLALSERPRFEVDMLGPVGEGASVGGRVRLGVGVSLP